MFNPLFKTWRKRLQTATHFSRLLGQNYKQATFNTFLHLVGDFLEFPLHANTTAWSKSSCSCSKFSFSGTNQCRRVEFFSHQTKNGNLRRRDGYFFLSGLLAGKSTLFVSSPFPVCFSSCKRGSPQTPPLTTRVSNMAACQFLFRIQIFSLCFLCLRLFSLYTTSASSIRGVSLTSKYFLLYLNAYRGDLRCKSGS